MKSVIRKKQTSKTIRSRCQIILYLDETHGKVLTLEQSARLNGVDFHDTDTISYEQPDIPPTPMKDIPVRISNDADLLLLTRTFHLLQEPFFFSKSPVSNIIKVSNLRRETIASSAKDI